MKRSALDDRDRAILSTRAGKRAARIRDDCPQVGDYVDFADGVTRRVSHVWHLGIVPGIQTSEGGSFYLEPSGACSFSGGLGPAVPAYSMQLTGATREGLVWFFHQDFHTAHNGIETTIPCAVWQCTLPSTND
jgi:hypothetical protein